MGYWEDRKKIITDIDILKPFIRFAMTKDASLPEFFELKINFDYADVTSHVRGLTPSGKIPKFPLFAQIKADEYFELPSDQPGWFEYYVNAPTKIRRQMDKEVEREANRPKDSVIVKLDYYPDGSIGKANIIIWHNKVSHKVYIRDSKDGLKVTKVARKRLSASKDTVLFKG